jgi:hypothetical protein
MTLLGTKRTVITTTCQSVTNCSMPSDKRLTGAGRFFQFGRTSAPMMPWGRDNVDRDTERSPSYKAA